MRRQPNFRQIEKISEAQPNEYVELFIRAMEGYVVKRYLTKFYRQGNSITVSFYNKNGVMLYDSWCGYKRHVVDVRNLENGMDSSKFRAAGVMHYLNKDDAYNDAINLIKNKKQKLNKAIVDLQYALHSVEV